jgi:hypothetical protein
MYGSLQCARKAQGQKLLAFHVEQFGWDLLCRQAND